MLQFRDERPLEKNWRDWVAVWRDDGNSYEQIIHLLAQKGHHTTKSTVKRILEKEFIPRKYHPVSIKDMELFSNIRDSVIRSYLDDSEATLSTIQKTIFNDFGEEVRFAWFGEELSPMGNWIYLNGSLSPMGNWIDLNVNSSPMGNWNFITYRM